MILSESGPGSTITISEDASHVCTVGGDGTARHVAMALARCGRGVPMSVYPGGTVNLLHRELLAPLDPGEYALRVLEGASARHHYAVDVNDTMFLTCASVGPDSRAVAALSDRLKRRIGRLAYVAAFLKVLIRWERQPILLEADGRQLACEAFYVAKGRYFAGPWSFAPEAGLCQPLLHVIALERARRRDFARFAWALLRGRKLAGVPGIADFTCTGFTASSTAALPIQADGDVIGTLPVRVQLRREPLAFH